MDARCENNTRRPYESPYSRALLTIKQLATVLGEAAGLAHERYPWTREIGMRHRSSLGRGCYRLPRASLPSALCALCCLLFQGKPVEPFLQRRLLIAKIC